MLAYKVREDLEYDSLEDKILRNAYVFVNDQYLYTCRHNRVRNIQWFIKEMKRDKYFPETKESKTKAWRVNISVRNYKYPKYK